MATLFLAGALLSTAPAKAALTLSSIGPSYDPPNTADRQFECLKGLPLSNPACQPPAIQENWVATAESSFMRINEWIDNETPVSRDQKNGLLPLNSTIPFAISYVKSTRTATFSYDNRTSTFSGLTRSPSINSLFFRTASPGNTVDATVQLTNLVLNTKSILNFSLGSLSSTTIANPGSPPAPANLRQINYLVVNGLPDEDFTITGDALVTGSRAGANWQMKAAYTPSEVPGPLPVLGGMAAFGWSRRLRRRLRQIPSSVSV